MYSARKHHVPTTFAVTLPESAVDLLSAPVVSVFGFPATAVPFGAGQVSAPGAPDVWDGFQMKKLTRPGGGPPGRVPGTSVCSATMVPTGSAEAIGVPSTSGVVTVVVESGRTVTHSLWPLSLDPRYVVPLGTYVARKHHTPAVDPVTA